MYGKGRQYETHKDAHRHGTKQIRPEAKRQQIYQLRHHRGQAGTKERRVDIAVHPRIMKSCIKPGAKQHGQYVDRVLAKKGKSRVDEKDCHGKAGERDFQPSDQGDAKPHHQACIEEGCAKACQFKVVSDQCVSGEDNGQHTDCDFFRCCQNKGGSQEENYGEDTEYKQLSVL